MFAAAIFCDTAGMDGEPKATEEEPRKRQITLGMIFGAVAYFAIALLGNQIPANGGRYIFLAVPAASVAITLIMTKGSAARGTALGAGIGCALAVVFPWRNPVGFNIVPAQYFIAGISTWIGAGAGAAERGHRFVAWVALISAGLFMVLAITQR